VRILVVGGTRFVGRHLVAEAVARGHEVTVLHRGIDCSGAPGAEHLHADRDADLGVLAGREWDATVDVCAYWPRQVDHLADALGDRGGRQALISTVSVYDRAAEPGLDEQASLVAPLGLDGDRPEIDAHTYGGLKVGCEQVAQHRYAGELLIIRPTYVVGPHDPTGRFPYWVDRMSRGGTVLAPGSPDAPIQYIDARDLARFVVELLEDGDDDTYHTVSPPPPYSFSDLLTELSRALSPSGTRLEWIPSEWLCQQGLTARDLPLWPESDEPEWALAMDPDRALAAGLRPRPLAESAVDTLAWMGEPSARWDERGLGLPAKREERLLAAWATRLAEPR
jgi:2'-hydroxyisoflavone reductase